METKEHETSKTTPEEHRAAIQSVLDQIRISLSMEGGDCELVDVSEDGKTVFVRLQGACAHCPSSTLTLKYGIEQVLRQLVPGVETVEQVS